MIKVGNMNKELNNIFSVIKSNCNTSDKRKAFNKLFKSFSEDEVVTTIEGRNLITVENIPDGVYTGYYDDFQFNSTDMSISLRFDGSSYGDSEFPAVVEVLNGVAAIYNMEIYQY